MSDNSLLPDPDRVRARLAEIARERQALRKVLRAVEGAQAGLSLNDTRKKTDGKEGSNVR
jgi:hypothetical protein